MSLFTSNSEKGGRTLVFALVLAGMALVSIECYWRASGATASVNPSADRALWAFHRRAVEDDERALAVIGTSRALFDIHPDELSQIMGYANVRQLAIVATHPLAVLEDLADDPHFHGSVICELTEEALSATAWDSQREYTSSHQEPFTLPERWGAIARAKLEEKVVLLNPALATLNRMKWAAFGINDVRTRWHADRSAQCVAGHEMPVEWNIAALENSLTNARADLSQTFTERLDRLNRIVHKLHDRNIPVVFVRVTIAPVMEDYYERYLPRRDYWDRMVKTIDAPFIRTADYPQMAEFLPPDGSHLCYGDALEFNRRLASILRDSRVLAREGNLSSRRQQLVASRWNEDDQQ